MSAAHPLLERLDDLVGNASSWLDRRQLGQHLRTTLEPAATREPWKYTPINSFLDAFLGAGTLGPVTALEDNAIQGLNQPGVAAVRFSAAAADEDLNTIRTFLQGAARFPLAELIALMAGDGLLIRVNQPLSEPLRVHHADSAFGLLLLEIAPAAVAELIETSAPTVHGDRPLSTQFVRINLHDGAQFSHTQAALSAEGHHFALHQAVLDENARYDLRHYATGAQRRRLETHILLRGRGAAIELDGASTVEPGKHLDQQIIVEHTAPDTRSRQRVHSIAAGRGRTVFNGRIHIHPGAPGSDAALSNKNLALDNSAEINTKPELEIYTDDVRCAHGATVGQLSQDSLFYLQSRGIAELQARRLLCAGFLKQCVHGPLAEQVTERFSRVLS